MYRVPTACSPSLYQRPARRLLSSPSSIILPPPSSLPRTTLLSLSLSLLPYPSLAISIYGLQQPVPSTQHSETFPLLTVQQKPDQPERGPSLLLFLLLIGYRLLPGKGSANCQDGSASASRGGSGGSSPDTLAFPVGCRFAP